MLERIFGRRRREVHLKRNAGVAWGEPLEPRHLLAGAPIISEFMASNSSSLADSTGANRDWIEIFNAGDAAIDLAGWHLTDDAGNLTKWTFPTANLPAGGFLIVFASGCDAPGVDCPPPSTELHTNFELTRDGEYIALVQPDGTTVVSSFGPGGTDYPRQFEDVSYGLGQASTLITSGAPARVKVPFDASLGNSWTAADFVPDPSWISGPTGVGYAPAGSGTVLALDFNDRTSTDGAADTQPGFLGMTQTQSGLTFNGVTVSLSVAGGATLDDRDRATPIDSGGLTMSQIYDDFIFANGTFDGAELQVRLQGLTPNTTYRVTLWSFDSTSLGTRVSNWTEIASGVPVTIEDNYAFAGEELPTSNSDHTMAADLTTTAAGELILRGVRNGGTSHGVFLNALRIDRPGIGDLVKTNISSQMLASNASAYVRVPFDVPAGAAYDELSLRMKYDAGFVAYLNGVEVARRNAPTAVNVPPAFNAAATLERDATQTVAFETINISAHRELLVPGGANVLAIHGLNSTFADDDFVILPELVGTNLSGSGLGQYFETATPGAANGEGVFGFVEDTAFSHDRGFYDAPFFVTISTPTPGASIYYTLDGSVPEAANPDARLFTFPIRVSSTTTLRAAAYRAGFRPTDVDTQTYLFLDDVVRQDEIGVNYVQISNANTVGTESGLADWALPTVNGDSTTLWVPRQAVGTATAFGTFSIAWQSAGAVEPNGVPMITVTMSGLNPGEFYDVFVNFWDADAPNAWNVRAGLTPTSLFQFTADNSYFTGQVSGNRLLYNGHVGEASPDASGTIRIYIDDVPPNTGGTRTFLDSVGYMTEEVPAFVRRSFPAIWQADVSGDFAMDPQVVTQWDDDNPANTDFGIREALLSLPTMSIVMDQNDLWSPTQGIYPNATSTGTAWRRPASIEYYDPATGEEFQYNAGIQMHGGASRDNVRQKKHSFRLIFNDEFDGPNSLRFPLFGENATDDINTVVLRAFFTDSFATRTQTGRYSPLDSMYLRDVWMRETQLAMGNPSAHSSYVHLYINGLYWGLYNPSERPDDAFQAAYLGGNRDDYDIIKDFDELFHGNRIAWDQMFSLTDQITAGNANAIYQQLQGNNADGTRNPALPALLDIDNFSDFMLLHLYGGAEDWPHHNWYAARDRVGETTGFKFYVWDQEIVLDGRYRDRTEAADAGSPAELFSKLRASSEFRTQFGDRVQKHMFGGGALSTAASQARWMEWADKIEPAIIAESARWGDARAGESIVVDSGDPAVTVPTLTVNHWRVERDNVHDNYFPQSHSLAVSRFITDGLYPTVAAPLFNQFGGLVPAGFQLSISNPDVGSGGTIYYTTDGSDPRAVGGNVSVAASAYAGPITLLESGTIRARIRTGTSWSALVDSFFSIESPLRVSEVHYNPAARTQAEIDAGVVDRDDFEFIELVNTSATVSVNLGGVRFADGIEFTFPVMDLAPGARVVVAQNATAFAVRYGAAIAVAGQYGGTPENFRLSNAGEQITLVDAAGAAIQSFTYDDAWQPTTDGDGPSLVVVDELAATSAWNDPANWRASFADGGSPGTPDVDSPSIAGDFDGDDRVGLSDLMILQRHFGAASGATPAQGDANGDGAVNAADLAIVAGNFGEGATTPGPSAAAADAVLAQAGAAATAREGRRTRNGGAALGALDATELTASRRGRRALSPAINVDTTHDAATTAFETFSGSLRARRRARV